MVYFTQRHEIAYLIISHCCLCLNMRPTTQSDSTNQASFKFKALCQLLILNTLNLKKVNYQLTLFFRLCLNIASISELFLSIFSMTPVINIEFFDVLLIDTDIESPLSKYALQALTAAFSMAILSSNGNARNL